MSKMRRHDLIVIGGGIAGLAAAAFAARAGKRVVLLERSTRLGGRARSSEVEGFLINLGPRALYPPAARLLDELGVHYTSGRPPKTGYVLADNRLHPMPNGPEALLDMPLFSGTSARTARHALLELLSEDQPTLARVSLAAWAARHRLEGLALQYLYSVVRLASYIDAPHLLSSEAVRTHLTDSAAGVRYVDGGWQTIVVGLERIAANLGVSLRLRTRVTAVETDRSGVTGVTLADGESVRGSSVVLSVDPVTASELLSSAGGMVPQSTPVQAAVLDVALSSLPNPAGGFIFALDRPLYLSVHSLVSRLAPSGGAVIHAARYGSPGQSLPGAETQAELEWLLDQVQPGWRDVVIHRRFLPSMTVTHALPEASKGGLVGRPAVEVDGLSGAYLAGDWVGADHMLAASALASAKRASCLAVRRTGALPASSEV